jgi:hypothetical protein
MRQLQSSIAMARNGLVWRCLRTWRVRPCRLRQGQRKIAGGLGIPISDGAVVRQKRCETRILSLSCGGRLPPDPFQDARTKSCRLGCPRQLFGHGGPRRDPLEPVCEGARLTQLSPDWKGSSVLRGSSDRSPCQSSTGGRMLILLASYWLRGLSGYRSELKRPAIPARPLLPADSVQAHPASDD